MSHLLRADRGRLCLSLAASLALAAAAWLLSPSGVAAQSGVDPAPTAAAAEPGEPAPPMADAAAPGPSDEQIHDELRAVKAAMEKALNEKDLDALTAHVTPDVVFTTMNGDVVRGPQAIRDYYRQMMEGEDRVVESVTASFVPDDLSILYGGDTAIAYGVTDDHYVLADGKELDIAARWTATLVSGDGGWKIAAFHYSTNMFDNPVLEAQRRVLVLVAVGAAVLAFIVALLLGRSLGRRSATA